MKRGERFALQSGLRQQPKSIFSAMYKSQSAGGFHDHAAIIRKQHTALLEWLAYWHHPFENRKAVIMPDANAFGRNIKPIKTLNTARVELVQGLQNIPSVIALYWPSGFCNNTPLARVFQVGVGGAPSSTTFQGQLPLVTAVDVANINYGGTLGTQGAAGTIVTSLTSPVTTISNGYGRTTKVSYKISCYGQPDEIQGKMRVVYLDRRLNLANACLCYNNYFPPVGTIASISSGVNVPDFRIDEFDLPTVYAKGGVFLEHITHLDEDYVMMSGNSSTTTGVYAIPEREATLSLTADALPNILLYFEGLTSTAGQCPVQIDIVTQGEVIDHREPTGTVDHVTPTTIPPRSETAKLVKQVNQFNQTQTPASARYGAAYTATQALHEANDVNHVVQETKSKLGSAVSAVKAVVSRGRTPGRTPKAGRASSTPRSRTPSRTAMSLRSKSRGRRG